MTFVLFIQIYPLSAADIPYITKLRGTLSGLNYIGQALFLVLSCMFMTGVN